MILYVTEKIQAHLYCANMAAMQSGICRGKLGKEKFPVTGFALPGTGLKNYPGGGGIFPPLVVIPKCTLE